MKNGRQETMKNLPPTAPKKTAKAGNDVFSQYFSPPAAREKIKI
jgi:hypothetical protein